MKTLGLQSRVTWAVCKPPCRRKKDLDRWKHCMLSRAWVMVTRANPGGGTIEVKAQHEITMERRWWKEGEEWKKSSKWECLGQTWWVCNIGHRQTCKLPDHNKMVIEWLNTYPWSSFSRYIEGAKDASIVTNACHHTLHINITQHTWEKNQQFSPNQLRQDLQAEVHNTANSLSFLKDSNVHPGLEPLP